MYFLSIKRYNLEYTKSQKTREWDQSIVSHKITIVFVLGKFCRNRVLCIIKNINGKNILISKSI